MRAKPLYKDRYPGLQPFDKGQSTIFFGRDQEKKELYYQVCLEKMVVLFGKSGLGKSSLLNAGVSPLLESNGYLPIRVRFSSGTQASENSSSENLLIRDFILAFEGFRFKRKIIYNKENPQLWEFIKATRFTELIKKEEQHPELLRHVHTKQQDRESEKISVIPVFIFDQFEEFFNHPVYHQQEFLSQLAEIVHAETPHRILDWITRINPEQRKPEQIEWHQQPVLKIVFALRSDKLANMQSLVSYIPTVLRNRYELKPLTTIQAAQAIKGPAAKPDLGPEYVPPFSFNETTLTEIVQELSGESNEIESSQLQIVCNVIEQRVREGWNMTNNSAPVVVNSSIINPKTDFPLILDNFYDTQLEKIPDPKNRELARKLIEDDLVISGQRDSISKRKLNNTLNISDNLIDEILITRLIREEPTSRGPIYELSHDTLVAPVEKSKNRRLRLQEDKKKEEERNLLAQEAIRKDEELKERYRQLATEIQLREDAQEQKKEVERLALKVKSRGRWVFFLTTALLIAAIVYNNIKLKYKISRREKAEARINVQLDSTKASLDSTKDSLNKAIAFQIKVIKNADSITQNSNSYNPDLDKIVDTLFRFNKELWEKYKGKVITKEEKITLLEQNYLKYTQKKNSSTLPKTTINKD
ncbi:MAG: hypothetical protein SGI83_00250 [Bacteroidota bacterium]|nr:hypothetical protein [Bacteroidota bacterium]